MALERGRGVQVDLLHVAAGVLPHGEVLAAKPTHRIRTSLEVHVHEGLVNLIRHYLT